jgi:hypothetical protein
MTIIGEASEIKRSLEFTDIYKVFKDYLKGRSSLSNFSGQ